MDDLIEACSEAIYNYSGIITTVSRRQIFEDLNFMKSPEGYGIQLDEQCKDGRKVYYRYTDANFSINNQPLNSNEQIHLKEALLTLTRFKGLPQFEWIDEVVKRLDSELNLTNSKSDFIEFEQNLYLKGLNFVSDLYEAIVNEKCLTVSYQSFKVNEPIEIQYHPYFLKQYNNRWFVFGRNHEFGTIQNLSLDRIEAIAQNQLPYIQNTAIDFSEYFEDVIGVSVEKEIEVQTIKLEVDNSLVPYIVTKPLHESQRQPVKGEMTSLITIQVIPNFELEAVLLSFGEKVKVLEPVDLQAKLKSRIDEMTKNYEL